jgi:hypothetical protein
LTPEAREESIAEVEGPKGTAEILEVTMPGERVLEVEYVVIFNGERRGAPSLGEAHLLANQMVGIEQGV